MSRLDVSQVETATFGDLPLFQCNFRLTPILMPLCDAPKHVGEDVWIGTNLHAVRAKGKSAFVILRERMDTLQACAFAGKDTPIELVKFISKVPRESILLLYGTVVALEPKRYTSCSVNNCEVSIKRFFVVERAINDLPLLVEDAMRPESEYDKPGTQYVRPGIDTKLNYRVIDLRTPANQALFRIRAGIISEFRNFMISHDFMEIQTPKLIGQASEGGSAVFEVKYFDRKAYLAQSPQLYKQMCISSGFKRVFEIGPVFRAENSLTNRHLTEFTGLDLEMESSEYHEVIRFLLNMLYKMISNIYTKYDKELATIGLQYPIRRIVLPAKKKDCPILTHRECVKMLRDAPKNDKEPEQGFGEDLSFYSEKAIGDYVKEKYGSELYAIDRYPYKARPFYTMPTETLGSELDERLKKAEEDGETIIMEDGLPGVRYSNSFDMFLRGNEICSGAQRIHNADVLKANMIAKDVDPATLQSYLDAFSYGCPPHAGAGFGLDRLVMLIVDMDSVRQSTLFPRTPVRLTP